MFLIEKKGRKSISSGRFYVVPESCLILWRDQSLRVFQSVCNLFFLQTYGHVQRIDC